MEQHFDGYPVGEPANESRNQGQDEPGQCHVKKDKKTHKIRL
jgi:hypothetical protein